MVMSIRLHKSEIFIDQLSDNKSVKHDLPWVNPGGRADLGVGKPPSITGNAAQNSAGGMVVCLL
jgi:hypothetical protein